MHYKFTLIFFAFISFSLQADRPNILFCISDDQSYAHTGANGDPVVQTPAFDEIARNGIRFTHAFCDAPTCGPSRSAILTGQSIWRLEEAANIHSTLNSKFETYPDLLREAGYHIGYTGKGWSPGNLKAGGRDENPAGPLYTGKILTKVQKSMKNTDYTGNFETFLNNNFNDAPFCFWLGTSEPHRGYELGAGIRSGKDPKRVIVPGYLPDTPTVRSDILDYYMEVEHFDNMVARAIALLKKRGLFDNTIIVITSDHGMPFPRAKASLYDSGSRVPLAISWPKGIINPDRVDHSLLNLSQLAPTFLKAAGLVPPSMMHATSINTIFNNTSTYPRDEAYIAMERHDGCRAGGKGYPCRAIRTQDFLYIHNFEPHRMPSGSADQHDCARFIPYGEIDSSPTKSLMMNSQNPNIKKLASLAFDPRPADELYDLHKDPYQLQNLAQLPEYKQTLNKLKTQLMTHLKNTGDPRLNNKPIIWDHLPYYGRMKNKNWAVLPAAK